MILVGIHVLLNLVLKRQKVENMGVIKADFRPKMRTVPRQLAPLCLWMRLVFIIFSFMEKVASDNITSASAGRKQSRVICIINTIITHELEISSTASLTAARFFKK